MEMPSPVQTEVPLDYSSKAHTGEFALADTAGDFALVHFPAEASIMQVEEEVETSIMEVEEEAAQETIRRSNRTPTKAKNTRYLPHSSKTQALNKTKKKPAKKKNNPRLVSPTKGSPTKVRASLVGAILATVVAAPNPTTVKLRLAKATPSPWPSFGNDEKNHIDSTANDEPLNSLDWMQCPDVFNYDNYCAYVNSGAYVIGKLQKISILHEAFLEFHDEDKKMERVARVKTHLGIKSLLRDAMLDSQHDFCPPRAVWQEVLPHLRHPNRHIAAVWTMIPTARTRDATVLANHEENVFVPGCDYSVAGTIAMGVDAIEARVMKLGIGKTASKAILYAARKMMKLGGKLPDDYRDLRKWFGFGNKISLITLQAAYGICQGIGVDSHVMDDTHHFRWTCCPYHVSPHAEVTRACLELMFPRSEWHDFNDTYGCLGQILQDKKKCDLFLSYARAKAAVLSHPFDLAHYKMVADLARDRYGWIRGVSGV
jgi:endonuclease III